MIRRLKRYQPFLFVIIGLFIFLPPLLFCQNIPTACNIFFKKKMVNSGPCGSQSLFPKDQSWESGIVSTVHIAMVYTQFDSSGVSFLLNFKPASIVQTSPPLRC